MNNLTKLLFRDAFFSTLLSYILIVILALFFFNIRFFNPIHKAFKDFSFLDVYYAEKFHKESKVNTDIVLVNIPNNRLDIVILLERIIAEEPKLIGLDVIFKDLKNESIDSMLESVLVNSKIVTSFDIQDGEIIQNHSFFGDYKTAGFVNFNFDDQTSVIRDFEGKMIVDNNEYLSLAVQMAKKFYGEKWYSLNYDRKLKNLQTIKYHGYYDKFLYLDYDDFNDYERKVTLKNKIVIMGYLGSPTGNINDIEDKYFTPINNIFTGKSIPDMFGVTIHANILNMMLKDDFFITVTNFWIGIITFLGMFFSTVFYMKMDKHYKISFRTRKRVFQFVVSVLILILSFWLFEKGIVFKPAVLIIGIILAGSYFKYYKHFTRYLKTKTKTKWKTYLK